MREVSFFLVLVLLGVASAAAQFSNATVNGIVLDPSGAAIAGAQVVVVNDATGIQYTTKTNGEGIYVVPNLPPGPYRIQVSNTGFKTIIKPDITLHVQDAMAINFTLPIGAVSEIVTIRGGAPLVNTESPAVSTVIDRNFVSQLPMNGRSFNTLLQLTPGVVIAPSFVGAPGQFSISGQRTSANNFTVDGVSANFGVSSGFLGGNGTGAAQAFSALGGTSSLVSVEALQEFRIETSSFAPALGHSPGGQVILTTRSGTNDLHGAIYEYFRNDVMDANDWFADQRGLPRAPERHNDFGGFLGGPIWKDKTFYFLSYEGARLRIPTTQLTSVPSEWARTVAASPTIAPYLNTFPQPDDRTVTPGVYTSSFTGNYSNSATLNAGSVRIDHVFSERFSIFGRYNMAPSEFVQRSNPVNTVDPMAVDTVTYTFGANMLLRNRLSNSVRANYSAQKASSSFMSDSFGGAVPLKPSLLLGGLSSAGVRTQFATFDTGFYATGPVARNEARQFNVADELAIALGPHQLEFGGDSRSIFLDVNAGASAGLRFVDFFALNVHALVSTQEASLFTTLANPAHLLSQSHSLFAQDTWKITHRVSLTYGLRWELAPAPSARGNTSLASWMNVNDSSNLALAPLGTPVWRTAYTNFAPRIGIAYGLSRNGDLVLRAGWGLFYDLGADSVAALATSFPNFAFRSGPGPLLLPVNDVTPYLPLPVSTKPPFPAIGTAFSPDLNLPRSYQWNVALEKSLGGQQALSLTYVGQGGRDLTREHALFQPNSNFSSEFLLTDNSAFSNYHALQLQYRRPLSARLQALLNYTWSHSLDNASNDALAGLSNTVVSAANDYASSDFDVRHSFSGAVVFNPPPASKSGFLATLTNEWSLNTVVVARSGFPFNAQVTSISVDPGGRASSRPDRVPGQSSWIGSPTAPGGKVLNYNQTTRTGAFSIPSAVRQGTEGRNDIPGFGLTQVDLSLSRKFRVTERLGLQFRADAFNLFNHPNFTNPLGAIDSSPLDLQSQSMLNRGLSSGAGLNALFQEGGPRSLQLSLKLNF